MPYKDPEAKRAHSKAYRLANLEKITAYNQEYQLTHVEQRRGYVLKYMRAHPEVGRKSNRAWRLRNLEQQRERERLKNKKRRIEQPEKVRAAKRADEQRRRAQKKGAPRNDLTHAQWVEIQEAQDHRCYYCGKRCKGRLTQDHITPLSEGGSHTLHNVIGACRNCNSQKHTGPPPTPVQPLLLTIAPAKKDKKAS